MTRKRKVNDSKSIDKSLPPLSKILPKKNNKTYLYAPDIFKKRVATPKTCDGKSFYKHTNNNGLFKFYNKLMFDVLEAMMFDFIQGDIIIFDKKRDLKFFMGIDKASTAILSGKYNKDIKIKKVPKLDLAKLDYGFPRIMMELGYKDKPAAYINIPPHMYMLLIGKMYEGKRYIGSSKENATPQEYYDNVIKHREKWHK